MSVSTKVHLSDLRLWVMMMMMVIEIIIVMMVMMMRRTDISYDNRRNDRVVWARVNRRVIRSDSGCHSSNRTPGIIAIIGTITEAHLGYRCV